MNFFTILVIVMCPFGTLCQFNMTAYREMPPLYSLEDYDVCLEKSAPSSYCLVIGEIVPNTTSQLWNQIATFSAVTKRHYRHDLLYFGVCINPCKQLVRPLSSFRKDQLYAGKLKTTELIEFFTDIYQRDSDTRTLNHKVINDCLNYNFEKQYGLQVRSFVQYCDSNAEPLNFDFSEIIFMLVVGVLLFLVVLSSSYDGHLKRKQPSNVQGRDFYQQRLETQQDTLLTSFSLYRNYYRLNASPHNETGRDLRFLEAYRFFGTLIVIFAHVLLILKGTPTANTEFVEKTFYNIGTNIVINGSVIIQIFLVISSFLLCVNFQQTMALNKPGATQWVQLVLYRYLRLAPTLAFTILLSASILPRLQDGPFFRHLIGAEHYFCRETWWRNLLFINNFTLKKSCLHQTWYLAADVQLYVIFAALLILIARFPHTRNYILGAGVVVSCLFTGMVTYFRKLDAIHQETPGSYRYLFWTDGATIYESYTPFYMNFGGYVFGIIAAFIYLKYKNAPLYIKENKAKLNKIVLVSLPLPFLLLLSGEIFYRIEFTKPSIWSGIYAGLCRNIWAFMCAALMLAMAFKIGFILYRFCSMKLFLPLGRLSYQVFLIHMIVIRCLAGCVRQPLYFNRLVLIMFILASIALSYAFAFFLYLFLELPLANIINTIIKGSVKRAKDVDLNPVSVKDKKETTTA